MDKKIQAKHLLDEVILRELAKHQGKWMGWSSNDPTYNIKMTTYPDVPDKVWLAKMKSIMKRGLSGGCDCGCRGDYEITDKGLELIGEKRTVTYNGY
jgi:hypothetical protein